jgi:pilus assembly protein TadC
MKLTTFLTTRSPRLREELRLARIGTAPEAFIKRSLRIALIGGIALAALLFFFQGRGNTQPLPILLAFLLGSFLTYRYLLLSPRIAAAAVAKDIDREVLFAGRFLLIKLNSGTPLVNALIEASKSEGVAGKYFGEIVRDIELGTPLEEAIDRATRTSPSKHWRKILFQISNALRLGIDVSHSLESVLEDIQNDYLLQIQRYGKKLSTMTLFYLLLAIVFPSLGMTIFVVLISFTSIPLSGGFFIAVLTVVTFIQVVFLQTFRAIRPQVNL